MKKFLSKKPVMISFVVAAALFLAVYVGMLVRPVSYGFNYTYKDSKTYAGVEYKITQKLNFKSDKIVRMTSITQEGDQEEEKVVQDTWIYRDGDMIVNLGIKKYIKNSELTEEQLKEANKSEWLMNETEYEERVKAIKEMKKNNSALYKTYLNEEGFKIDIFSMELGEDDGKMEYANNAQAIVFTVVHGVVTVALVTFATLSIVFFATRKNWWVEHSSKSGTSEKSRTAALLLNFFLGGLGVHRFYAGKVGTGLLWLFTGGCFGIGSFVDFIMIVCGNFKDKEGNLISKWS